MTPKQTASTLVINYLSILGQNTPIAVECSLVAVNHLLGVLEDEREGFNWKNHYKEVIVHLNNLNTFNHYSGGHPDIKEI